MSIIAVSYARTSGESGDSVSLDTQLNANRKFADAMGITVTYEFKEEFTGTKIERPKMNEVRKLIAQRKVNAIIVYITDRLARSEYVAGYLLHEVFAENGIRLFIASGSKEVDPANPDSVLMFSVESSFSAHEVRKIRERTTRGKRGLLEEGIWVGEGQTDKYGYRKEGNKRNTRIERVESELDIVALTFDLFVNDDLGVQRIVDEYNARGIDTPSVAKGISWVRRNTWHKAMIYRILKDEAYTGKWSAHKYKRVPNNSGGYKHIPLPKEEWIYLDMPHTRIISDELFKAAQEKLAIGRSVNAPGPNPKNGYLLARHCKCGECGYAMFSKQQGKWKDTTYSYYKCGGREEKRTDCTMPAFSIRKVDVQVWTLLEQFLTDATYRMVTLQEAQERQNEQHSEALEYLQSADRVKARIQDELYRLLELYTQGLTDIASYKRKKAELDDQLNGADRVIAEYQAVLGSDYLTNKDIDRIDREMSFIGEELQRLGGLPFDRKRKLVESMGIQVTFHRERLDGTWYHVARVFVYGVAIGTETLGVESSTSYLQCHYHQKVLIGVIRL